MSRIDILETYDHDILLKVAQLRSRFMVAVIRALASPEIASSLLVFFPRRAMIAFLQLCIFGLTRAFTVIFRSGQLTMPLSFKLNFLQLLTLGDAMPAVEMFAMLLLLILSHNILQADALALAETGSIICCIA